MVVVNEWKKLELRPRRNVFTERGRRIWNDKHVKKILDKEWKLQTSIQ